MAAPALVTATDTRTASDEPEPITEACACRKSSSEVLMVKSAEKSPKYNPAGGMDGTRQRGVFAER